MGGSRYFNWQHALAVVDPMRMNPSMLAHSQCGLFMVEMAALELERMDEPPVTTLPWEPSRQATVGGLVGGACTIDEVCLSARREPDGLDVAAASGHETRLG